MENLLKCIKYYAINKISKSRMYSGCIVGPNIHIKRKGRKGREEGLRHNRIVRGGRRGGRGKDKRKKKEKEIGIKE